MELGHYDALGTVDDEGSGRRHVRDVAQIYVLNLGLEVLVLGVAAGKAEFCLERHFVGVASLKTFLDGKSWGIEEIINEFELVTVPRILDGENLLEDIVQALVAPVLRWSVHLEEVAEGLQLDLKQVRILQENL